MLIKSTLVPAWMYREDDKQPFFPQIREILTDDFQAMYARTGLDVLFHCACQELPVNGFKSISIPYNLPGAN